MSGGEIALIILAVGWVVLIGFLIVVLFQTSSVLISTRMTIDTMREETVPLLREVKVSLEKTNGHLDRVGTVLDAAGSAVQNVQRITGLVQQATESPLIKIISFGAGARKAAKRFRKGP
jgi:uncharacterized protein YoxC